MNTITLSNDVSVARISADFGFNCYEFRAEVAGRRVDVIHADPSFPKTGERPSGNGIPLLFPFPNRIRQGRFSFAGRDYHISREHAASDALGNAIHGFCLDRPWRVLEQSDSSVLGAFQLTVDAADRRDFWPADFLIEVRYTLVGAALRAEIGIVNPDTQPLPWGFGTHAYFKVPLGDASAPENCLAIAPTTNQWLLDEFLPTGELRHVAPEKDLRDGVRIGTVKLDDVLTGVELENGILECSVMDESAGLQVTQRCPEVFREVVAFTPDWCQAVCLEPYTCVTDAVNLDRQGVDAGLQILEPGGQTRTWIEIRAGQILV